VSARMTLEAGGLSGVKPSVPTDVRRNCAGGAQEEMLTQCSNLLSVLKSQKNTRTASLNLTFHFEFSKAVPALILDQLSDTFSSNWDAVKTAFHTLCSALESV
jgi:hypothetical protein